jgi:hypothetical protein
MDKPKIRKECSFLKKKNQETFACCRGLAFSDAKEIKVFCFFFS